MVPDALQAPAPGPEVDTQTPLAIGDLGWMNGTPREKAPIFDTKFFTPEIRLDMNFIYSGNHPIDHTIVGSTEEFRSGEFQIEQVSFGGDFHWNNVRARFLSMFSACSRRPRRAMTPAVPLASGTYPTPTSTSPKRTRAITGTSITASMSMSAFSCRTSACSATTTLTIGPTSRRSVSSNTPWFFNGLRVQWWPTQTLKIEPWLISHGWQSYAKCSTESRAFLAARVSSGIPNDRVKLVFNSYSIGQDNLSCQANNPTGSGTVDSLCQPQNGGNPNASAGSLVGAGRPIDWSRVKRIHEDDSLEVKYYDAKGQGGAGISKMAFSWTVDIGCEYGGGVTCSNGQNKANFFGSMLYNRVWFHNDLYALTLGGGFMNNPGRYLALTPPINGATAASGTPCTLHAATRAEALSKWDTQLNFQYMPDDWITWWTEATFRHSSVPYWSGAGGVTPLRRGNNGAPASCVGGGSDATTGQCVASDWFPDLRTREVVMGAGVLVKF